MIQDVETFLSELEMNGRKKSTLRNNHDVLCNLFKTVPRNCAADVTVDDMRGYLATLKARVGNNTFFLAVCTLRKFFGNTGSNEGTARNGEVYTYLLGLKVRLEPVETEPFTQEQIMSIADYFAGRRGSREASRKLYHVVALVLPATGLRIGEFCGLNLSDVAIEEGLFCFHVGNKISKTGVARDVWFSSDGYAGEAFKSHLYERMADANRRGLGDAPLFINVYGRRLTPFRVEERYRQAKKALGIRGRCTPHVNRHTFASFLIQEKGVDAKTVSELTGHSVETLLHVYTHVSVKKKKAVARDCVIV